MRTVKLVIIVFSIFFAAITDATAQQVVSSAGKTWSNSNLQMSFTVGEIDVVQSQNQNIGIQSGFNTTPKAKSTKGIKPVWSDLIELYPNPTNGEVKITWKGVGDGLIRVVDGFGRTLSIAPLNHQQEVVDLTSYSSGIYFIQIEISGVSVNHRILKW